MGARGPAGKPTALRVLHGDRPSRINRDEPKPRALPPQAPPWLTAAAAAEWARIVPDLVTMGTVYATDTMALAAYCEAVGRLQLAVTEVERGGLLVADRDGDLRKNAAVAMARDATHDVRVLAREFGLTPSARAGLRVVHEVQGDAARLLTQG